MENRNCRNCGKVFRYVTGYPLCNECKLEDEDLYRKIKEYIRFNPGKKIEDVAKSLDINPREVLRFLREERLEIPANSEKYLMCEFCGKTIRTGRFCESCKKDIDSSLDRKPVSSLGDTYYYNEDEEKKIEKLRNEAKRKGKKQ